MKKKTNLLDLGSYPGGWSVASKIITEGKFYLLILKICNQFIMSNFYVAIFFNQVQRHD